MCNRVYLIYRDVTKLLILSRLVDPGPGRTFARLLYRADPILSRDCPAETTAHSALITLQLHTKSGHFHHMYFLPMPGK